MRKISTGQSDCSNGQDFKYQYDNHPCIVFSIMFIFKKFGDKDTECKGNNWYDIFKRFMQFPISYRDEQQHDITGLRVRKYLTF